jgi:endonuclease YncB( thermonuclease family)
MGQHIPKLCCVLEVRKILVLLHHRQTASVIRIHDGDTITAQISKGNRIQVRLSGIDAPELKQQYGIESRNALIALLKNETPTLDCFKTDKYRRQVCRIFTNSGTDVPLEMITTGNAWWYKIYSIDQTAEERGKYSVAEESARSQQRGLWSLVAAAPWDWRAAQKKR